MTHPLNRRQFLHGCGVFGAGAALVGYRGLAEVSSARSRGLDAFLAGYPLVTTVRTMQTFARLVGVNRLYIAKTLANPTSRLVVAPNRDTVYVLAVLDLRDGPLVLTLPDITARYHVFQFIDAWMGNFALVGTRTTGGQAGSWIIRPPGSDAAVPDGVPRLDSPTPQAILLGRVRAVDEADAAIAANVMQGARLAPLASSAAAVSSTLVAPPAGTPQSVGQNGLAYFDELGDALTVSGPVTAGQRRAIAAAAGLGVGPGRHPSSDPGARRAVLRAAVTDGLDDIEHRKTLGGRDVNGWTVNLHLGEPSSRSSLLQNATIARYFWGPVPTEEAVYPRATTGSDGRPLDGSKCYRIHFAEGQLPPVDAFWSVTVYGPDMFLVPNRMNRYSLSGDTPGLVTNADGSLDLHLQRAEPAGHAANWIPVPEGAFNLIMRLYLPRSPIRDGTYRYPEVRVVGGTRGE